MELKRKFLLHIKHIIDCEFTSKIAKMAKYKIKTYIKNARISKRKSY